MSVPPPVRDLLEAGPGRMRAIWDAMPVQAKKDCVRELLVVRVRPAERRGGSRGFDESRVVVERASGESSAGTG